MYITISTSTVELHVASEDELTLLGQVIDIDGEDKVITSREPAYNGSRRRIGEHWTITDDAWDAVQASLIPQDQDEAEEL